MLCHLYFPDTNSSVIITLNSQFSILNSADNANNIYKGISTMPSSSFLLYGSRLVRKDHFGIYFCL